MKRFVIPLLIFILFLAGIAIVVYPVVSNQLYEKNQSHVTAQYDETVEQMGREALEAELLAAQEYNRSLLESEAFLTDPLIRNWCWTPQSSPTPAC